MHQIEGEANHRRVSEKFNLTLRQRLARFIRKTLAFSKSVFMYILRYDQEQAANYKLSLPT